jgi:3-dehydroquinate synthase
MGVRSARNRRAAANGRSRRIRVGLGARSYAITIGTDGAALLATSLANLPGPWCIVTDTNVRRHVWRAVAPRLRHLTVPEPLVVPAGETSKRWETLARLQTALLRRGYGRDVCIVALGGGVVLDLAGFAAATYLRGVDWIAVPTTLLAMVDAAVGGKVGVDLDGIKNSVGAFHQPRAVLAGTDFLATLPQRERRSGLAEVIKYAMIRDRRLWADLVRDAGEWSRARAEADAALVARCCAIKARIVAADEREAGERAVLNFGHTVGHALEGDGRRGLRHGEAVGLGMLVACAIAESTGVAREPQRQRLQQLLQRIGLPVRTARRVGVARLRRAWRRDKKARGGVPSFVLTPRIGAASVGHRVPEDRIVAALHVISGPRPALRPRSSSQLRAGAKRRAEVMP